MAMTALAIAGCSQNEITEVRQDANSAVGFSVYTGVPTRGKDVSNTTMQGTCDVTHYGGFGIMAYYTGSKSWSEMTTADLKPTFMFNQKVTYETSSNAWTYSPVKYWPNDTQAKVSFFAYAPYESSETGDRVGIVTSKITETGTPKITFTLKPTNKLEEMVDLVVADAKDKSQTDDAIEFKFAHILSRIAFKAKLGADYAGLDGTESFIYITHMWIVGSTQTNSLSILTPKLEANNKSKFYTKATWKDLKWDYTNATIAQEDYNLNSLMKMETDKITEIWDGSGGTDSGEKQIEGIKLYNTDGHKEVNLFKDDHFLYLIPVNETSATASENNGSNEDEIQIGFHYDIVTKTQDSTDDSPKYLVSHMEKKVSLNKNHMKRNTKYTYTFTINLKEIKVTTAQVDPWGEDSGNFPMQ